ncbi:MAG TPA: CpsD/CapB family tyrosine-protein kinase [Actinomycetota bacterium]
MPELLDALRWRWKLVVAVALGVFVGATLYVESLPAEYRAEAIVTFAPLPDIAPDAVRVVVPAYVEYVTAAPTIERLADELGQRPDKLADAIDAQVALDTGNVTITATMSRPGPAAEAANAFAEDLVDFAEADTNELLSSQVIAEALPSSSPSGPPRRLLEGAALLVGGLLGVGLSLVVERGRPRLRSWHDIARMTGYPVVGRIPASRAIRTRPSKAFSDPGVGSAFRTLRTNLEREWQDRTIDIIVVTSPSSGDGKTTVSALFAESLARLGGQVLLVDADLRRPALAKTFKYNPDGGFAAVLRETKSLEEAVQEGWTEGLAVLPTEPDPDAGDLIARRFDAVMQDAREKYDVVVIDTPPLLGTDDARTITTMAKGVLLVVAARSIANPVNEAVLALVALKAPVLGVIGNRLRESGSYYTYTSD